MKCYSMVISLGGRVSLFSRANIMFSTCMAMTRHSSRPCGRGQTCSIELHWKKNCLSSEQHFLFDFVWYLLQLQLNHPLCIHVPQSKVNIWVTGSCGRPLGATGLHLHQGDHWHQLLQHRALHQNPSGWSKHDIKRKKCTCNHTIIVPVRELS